MTLVQIATFLATVCSSYLAVLAVPTGNHTCTGVTKIPVTVLVNVTVPVTFRSYTWCLRVPPRCSKYTIQLRDRVQLHTEMHNKTITVCCRGYVEMEGRCVPACPEGADCPFMHCNRTNHCYCTAGYTGLYCNDPCPRGVWGKDCKRPCDCPTGYTCHHLTGDCMVDDRPARRTTTTTEATTTTRKPTTLLTTEATTLETVKTPQFRFPPPPWIETAGTTTPRKLTTRIIRNEVPITVTNKEMEQILPTTPITTEKIRPPFIEFLTPAPNPPTTIQTTVTYSSSKLTPDSATVYITNIPERKYEYLPGNELAIVTEKSTVNSPAITAESSTSKPSSKTTIVTSPIEILPELSTTEMVFIPKQSITTIPTTVTTKPVVTTVATTHTPSSTETPTTVTTLPTIVFVTRLPTSPIQTTYATSHATTEKETMTVTTTPTAATLPSTVTPQLTNTEATNPPMTEITKTPSDIMTYTTNPTTMAAGTTTLTNLTTIPVTEFTVPKTETISPTQATLLPTEMKKPMLEKIIPTAEVTTTSMVQEGMTSLPDKTFGTSTQPQTTTLLTSSPIAIIGTIITKTNFKSEAQPTIQTIASSGIHTWQTHTKENLVERSTISPEFKVIKVIKTENSEIKEQKFSTPETFHLATKYYQNLTTDNKFFPKESVTSNIKINVHQQRPKLKEDVSPIIYISPTTKDKNSDGLTQNKVTNVKISESPIFFLPAITDVTPTKKDSTKDNDIHSNKTKSSDEQDKTTTVTVLTENEYPQVNRSILHSLFSNPELPEQPDIFIEPSKHDEHFEKKDVTELMSIADHILKTSIPTILEENRNKSFAHKKKSKDFSQKKSDETKIFIKETLESIATTLSPIHILKQLLNATSNPWATTVLNSAYSKFENLSPKAFEDDFTKEILNKKSKYDDLITHVSPEKGKKKHEKIKPNKHLKDGKDHLVTPIKIDKEPEIPIPPTTLTTSTTELSRILEVASQVPDETFIQQNIRKRVEQKPSDEKLSISKEEHRTTNFPKQNYQNTLTTSNSIKDKEYDGSENNVQRHTTENNKAEVTDNNNIVESNTIDTLHTSFEAIPKKDHDEEQEDSNYSIIYNKMNFVKTETLYGAAGMTADIPSKTFAPMLLVVGIASLTLIALTVTLWIYLKRRRRRLSDATIHPRIMAYALPEPTPIDVQTLEQTFFCPTFSINYIEKINQELGEISYDHPRSNPPEPLYAEIRY